MMKVIQQQFFHAKKKALDSLRQHGPKILLWIGILAMFTLAFESGFLVGREQQAMPVLLEKPAMSSTSESSEIQSGSEKATKQEEVSGNSTISGTKDTEMPTASPDKTPGQNVDPKETSVNNCVFVGSRNSDKYHLPKCSWAKRIKPENRVCFTSAADAESKGYKPGCIE